MKLRPLVVLAIVALVWLAGCATVSFKRGAGPGAAKADEDACRATTASPEDYADCLRNHGWMVNTPGVAAEPASAPAPAPGAPPAQGAPADAGLTPPAAVPAAKPAPHSATAPGPSGTAKPTTAISGEPAAPPTAPPETAPAAKASTPAAAVAPPAAKPLDPMTKVTVSSWWKMGGTNAQLDAAVKACVDELGPAHQPNVGPTEVTIALRDCLREKKWFAVGGTGGIGAARFTR